MSEIGTFGQSGTSGSEAPSEQKNSPVTACPPDSAAQPGSSAPVNLQFMSLEKLVKSKLELLFDQQREAQVELSGLYDVVLEQVERPLIELALISRNGNQLKAAQLLGINRNTLKKKIDSYRIKVRRGSAKKR